MQQSVFRHDLRGEITGRILGQSYSPTIRTFHRTYQFPSVHPIPIKSTTLLQFTTAAPAPPGPSILISLNSIPGHGTSSLHWKTARLSVASEPVMFVHVILESWKSDVSQPPVEPWKDVHCVIQATESVRFVTVKSRKAVATTTTRYGKVMSIRDRLKDERRDRMLTEVASETQPSATTYIEYSCLHLQST